ncbi:hypothetical protein G7Y89_g11417 [Cudoniella acicularis]|uniref:Carboxylesterase type B domain-containing protein n=1 Tax=Cudoniella acicularis TaxID=354080 RepID=A0A8H4VY17_9HELO|nr:hypothetical protein G7Y89_g11417 [Cudoniella acicularis]
MYMHDWWGNFPTALTNQGQVSGFEDAHGSSVFPGIPFAATTGGNNRSSCIFMAVQWSQVQVAIRNFKAMILQERGLFSPPSICVDYLWNHPDAWLAGAMEMSANAKSGPAYAPVGVELDVVASEVDLYDFETTYFNSTTNTWFSPAIDDITRYSNYVDRLKAGKYPTHVPLLTGNSNGEGTIFSIVYSGENTNFSSWINTFDTDVAHILDDVMIAHYNASDFSTASLESGTQYGDARFDCAVDYLIDLRSLQQDTWVYRFFGEYDNVVGISSIAPTHETKIPFFLGGNECFDALTNVTAPEQALADSMNDWLVEWVKNPSAGPGWDKVTPHSGTVALLGVPGNETEILYGETGDYNERCQTMYNEYTPLHPVVQNPLTSIAESY